jgi:hypothetical protein
MSRKSLILISIALCILGLFITWMYLHPGDRGHVDLDDLDSDGNLYIYGTFSDSIDFDPGEDSKTVDPDNSGDLFLARYDANNNLEWVYTWFGYPQGSYGHEAISGIAADTTGGVYLGGFFLGTRDLDFTEGISEYTSDNSDTINEYMECAFITKIDPTGSFQWARTWRGSFYIALSKLETTSAGDILAMGSYLGEVDFDPGPGQEIHNPANFGHVGGTRDFYISRFDADGNFVSVITWDDDTGDLKPSMFKLGSDDSLYISGIASEQLDVDPGLTEFNITRGELYLLKLLPDGQFEWGKSWSPPSEFCAIKDLAIDSTGNVYILCQTPVNPGTKAPPSRLNGNILTSGVLPNIFASVIIEKYAYVATLLKFEPGGNIAWEKSWGSGDVAEGAYADGLYFDNEGNIVVDGWFSGTIDFDPDSGVHELTSNKHSRSAFDRADGYTSTFDPAGNLLSVETSEPQYFIDTSGKPFIGIGKEVTYEFLDSVRELKIQNSYFPLFFSR